MLKIRLQRTGRKNQPHFRVVVCEHTEGPKTGNVVEQVGHRNPKTKDQVLDAERIKYWISVGAQPSDTVHNILVKEGIIEGKARNVLPRKSPVEKKEKEEKVETPAEGKEDSTPADPDGADASEDATSNGAGEKGEAPVAEEDKEDKKEEEPVAEAKEEEAPADEEEKKDE